MLPVIVDPDHLVEPLAAALDGGPCVAPLRPSDAAGRAMLRPDVPIAEPDAALVVATSGSTGEPKGVVLSRGALWASARATHDRLGGPGTWVCALPTHYVAGVMTLVRAHVAGTRPRFVAPDLHDLPDPGGRAYLSLVPTQLHRALAPGAPGAVVERLAAHAAILVGGAAVDPDLLVRARARGLVIVRTYGMSETCGGCVYDGVPLGGVHLDVADGRIAISGDVVFSGYRLRPDLTDAALTTGPHGRRLLTSDRGELHDEVLRVLGRVDDVVVTGGVNVDLAAVQRAVDAAFGAPDAGGLVVLGVPDAEWGTRIVAVTASDTTVEQLRSRLTGHLDAAALPKQVRRVRGIPRTGSGKIDRRALAAGWEE